MKPEHIGNYIQLKDESIQANRAFNTYRANIARQEVPGVENLDYYERFDRLYDTLMDHAELSDEWQSKFGKSAGRNYHVPMRIVTTESGEQYGLVFNIYVSRLGFRSAEKKKINAGWFDLEKKHSDTSFGPSEVVENGPIDIGTLIGVEWALDAYLTGTPREAEPHFANGI